MSRILLMIYCYAKRKGNTDNNDTDVFSFSNKYDWLIDWFIYLLSKSLCNLVQTEYWATYTVTSSCADYQSMLTIIQALSTLLSPVFTNLFCRNLQKVKIWLISEYEMTWLTWDQILHNEQFHIPYMAMTGCVVLIKMFSRWFLAIFNDRIQWKWLRSDTNDAVDKRRRLETCLLTACKFKL